MLEWGIHEKEACGNGSTLAAIAQADHKKIARKWPLAWYPLSGDPCDDRINLNTNPARVIRGASWFEDETWLNVPRRHEDPPGSVWRNVGVRCARVPR